MANSLEGRVAVIFGLANKRSIAWAIAQKLHADGAQIAITYQNDRLRLEAEEMITSLPGAQGFQCDVTNDEEITQVFQQIGNRYNGKIHTLVHSVAFAPADELKNDFLLTTREGFHIAHDISVYSLIALARAAAPLMTDGGSIMTLTYLGSEKVMQNYNVMGVAKAALESTMRYLSASLGPRAIRVNAISAGPIKTLAARGISNFSDILKIVSDRAPLKRNVETSEVAATAAFLASDGAAAITGEVIHVDCGYNVMGF
jgi:enoyl-[acyl-carrier protein] reductase I